MYLFIQECMTLGLNVDPTLGLHVGPTLGKPVAKTSMNIYNGIIFPSLNPDKIFRFISR